MKIRMNDTSRGDEERGEKVYQEKYDDKSGKITYREFSGMCREELKMKKSQVSDEELQGAWNALAGHLS